jgi:hypothetical protein
MNREPVPAVKKVRFQEGQRKCCHTVLLLVTKDTLKTEDSASCVARESPLGEILLKEFIWIL